MQALHGNHAESTPSQLISTRQAASLLGVSVDYVRRMVREGRFDAVQLGDNGRLRIVLSSLNQYIASRKVTRGQR